MASSYVGQKHDLYTYDILILTFSLYYYSVRFGSRNITLQNQNTTHIIPRELCEWGCQNVARTRAATTFSLMGKTERCLNQGNNINHVYS